MEEKKIWAQANPTPPDVGGDVPPHGDNPGEESADVPPHGDNPGEE